MKSLIKNDDKISTNEYTVCYKTGERPILGCEEEWATPGMNKKEENARNMDNEKEDNPQRPEQENIIWSRDN